MAGFLLGAGSGVLAGAAVYYTLSTTIAQNTALVRSELTNSSRVLESSFDPVAPPAAVSLVGPAYPTQVSFPELLRHKWNAAVGRAVSGVRDTNWSALGSAAVDAAQGAASRIGSVNSAEMAVSAAISVPDAIPVVVPDVAVDKPKVDVSAKEAEQAKVAKLRAETNVDAPLAPSPKITEVPKRLV